MTSTAFAQAETERDYQLSDDLARLCLPSEFKDSYRNLAWVNSVCLLILVIGLIGLKAPKVVQRPVVEPQEAIPVILTPPEEQPKQEPEVKKDEPEEQRENLDTPQVMTVVAVADSAAVAFSVPVQGAVAVSEARYATPPPPANYRPAAPVKFDPNKSTGGSYPPPSYPAIAIRNRYQGTVTIELIVDPSGTVSSVKVEKSSGFPALDEAAMNVVKNRWRFPPGESRFYYWPCVFQLQ